CFDGDQDAREFCSNVHGAKVPAATDSDPQVCGQLWISTPERLLWRTSTASTMIGNVNLPADGPLDTIEALKRYGSLVRGFSLRDGIEDGIGFGLSPD